LFVEEMTKAVLEAESKGEARQTVAAIPSPALAVPASLHASLMARLDRLGPAKQIAQIGAAIGREFSHALLAAVAHKPDAELGSALDRLIQADLLFRQGVPPHASYLFKHALVQDAAYGTLLRGPRRTLHARIAEVDERDFAEIAEIQPEWLAHHCAEAGLIEKAAYLWGSAGQRSLDRSALVEATEQLRRALDQMAALSGTPTLRREQIKLQLALATALMHIKGYAASEAMAALDRARLYMDRAQALGEAPEDPMLLFSALYAFWNSSLAAFNGDVLREVATQVLMLAQKQKTTASLMLGHRLMATSLMYTGDTAEARMHFDRAITFYHPSEHRSLTTRFGLDGGVVILSHRSLSLWVLGYADSALAESDRAQKHAREIGHAATFMFGLTLTFWNHILCRNYAAASAQADEVVALADKTGILFWKIFGIMNQGCIMALKGEASHAVQKITSGISAYRSTGSTFWMPSNLSYLARAYATLSQFDDAWRSIDEAITLVQTTKEKWWEAEVHRAGGEIELKSPAPDEEKAEDYFDRALSIAREQQPTSFELRAATSMARLWRDQDKRQQAHDLLAPVYGWFTEGFDTLDLKDAKALLEQLKA
jgi:predicted ATPase